ncbi:MAG: adenylate kinase [Nanoarchaeota archaeon]|nr:adenylate kinase [Nanoarchaeota archaeon]
MKNIILVGAPNAGKGTYSASLIKKYKIPHISTGDMFREAMKKQTPVGLEAKKYMDEGNLVPDEVTIKLVKERLSQPDCKKGFILDGFPRTIAQAEALDNITDITNVIVLDVSEEVVLQRVSGRIQCRKCGAIFNKTNIPPKKEGICDKCGGELYTRDDDKPESVKERLAIFAKQTAPLIDYYEEKGVVGHADANNPHPPEVVEEIIGIIGD